jgi:alkylation response protein AidB-like acyl-CoA dehydrogenase
MTGSILPVDMPQPTAAPSGETSPQGENNKRDAAKPSAFVPSPGAEPTVIDHALTSLKPLRQAIDQLVPEVMARAESAEQERKVPAENMAALRAAGLFRAFVPHLYGGDERSLSEVLDAATDLAAACPSTAWVATLFAIHNIAVCWLDRKGQDEIFADGPDALVGSSVAPMGTLVETAGGFRLTGRWSFSSGVEHAAWIMLGANLGRKSADAPPDYAFAFVRATEAAVIDDWHVAGLRGTGSKSLEVADVLVPRHRVVLVRTVQDATAPGLRLHDKPFYRLPWYPLFICAFPAAGLGTAIAMLEGFRKHIEARVDGFSGIAFKTTTGSAVRLAEAAATIDAARLVFRRDVAALDRAARDDGRLMPGEAERILYDAPFVMDACSRAVLQLFRGSGGKILYESNPLQRHFRDIHAMTQHVAMDLDRAGETYGRLLLQNAALALGARDPASKS